MATSWLKRRASEVAFAALMAISLVTTVDAQTLSEKVAKDGKLTIGIHNRWPWGLKKEDGTVSGVHPDVLKAVVAPLGVKEVDFVIMDWGALIPSLTSKRIDAVASGMAILPERCKQVSFSEPFLSSNDAALVKAGNPLKINSYSDMAQNTKVRVGDVRGASTTAAAVASGVAADRIQLFQDYNDLVAALLADRVDAILMTSGTALGIINNQGVKGIERAQPFTGQILANGKEERSFTAIAFRPEDADFRDKFNQSLATKKADGTVLEKLKPYGFTQADLVVESNLAKEVCQGNYR